MLHNIKPLYLHCVFHGIRFNGMLDLQITELVRDG